MNVYSINHPSTKIFDIRTSYKTSPKRQVIHSQPHTPRLENYSDRRKKSHDVINPSVIVLSQPHRQEFSTKSPRNILNSYLPSNKNTKIGIPNKENRRLQQKYHENLNLKYISSTSSRYNFPARELNIAKREISLHMKPHLALKILTESLQQIDEVNSAVAQSTEPNRLTTISSNITFNSLGNRSDLLSERNEKPEGLETSNEPMIENLLLPEVVDNIDKSSINAGINENASTTATTTSNTITPIEYFKLKNSKSVNSSFDNKYNRDQSKKIDTKSLAIHTDSIVDVLRINNQNKKNDTKNYNDINTTRIEKNCMSTYDISPDHYFLEFKPDKNFQTLTKKQNHDGYEELSIIVQPPKTPQSLNSSRVSNLNESTTSAMDCLEVLKGKISLNYKEINKSVLNQFFSQTMPICLDPCQDIIKKLRKIHKFYEDNLFVANITGLINSIKQGKKVEWAQNVEWRRISQIYNKYKNINICDTIHASVIRQGSINNYHLISALAAIAEYPFYISRLFGEQSYNEEGCYSVRTCRDGIWKLHVIDDYIPVLKDNPKIPAFIGINPNEQSVPIWPLLLEKAWAKAFGNYENIQRGDIGNTLKELTGAPSIKIHVSDPNFWNYLIEAYQSRFIIVAVCDSADELNQQSVKLDLNYGYTILGYCQINTSTSSECLIHLRNNWVDQKWDGEWNLNSSKWTPAIKKELQDHDINWNEGNTIWLHLKEFQNIFSGIIINKANELYISSHIGLRHNKNAHSIAEFKVDQNTTGYIEVTQMDRMLFRNTNMYAYSKNRVILFKKDGNDYKYIKGMISDRVKSSCLQVDLFPGQYVVLIIFDWNNDVYDFSLSFYGDSRLEWNRLRVKENPKLYSQLWYNTLISQGTVKNIEKRPEYIFYSYKLDEVKLHLDMIANESKAGTLFLRRNIRKMKENNYGYYISNGEQSYVCKRVGDTETIEFTLSAGMNQVIMFYQKELGSNMLVDYFDMFIIKGR